MKKSISIGITIAVIILLSISIYYIYTLSISSPKITPQNFPSKQINLSLDIKTLEDCITSNIGCLPNFNYPTLEEVQKLKEINGKSGKLICLKEANNFTKDCDLSKEIGECNNIWKIEYYYLIVKPDKKIVTMNSCNDKLYVYLEKGQPTTPYVFKEIILLD